MLFAKLIILGLFALAVFYVFVRSYLLSRHKAALRAQWAASGGVSQQEAFVARGMAAYAPPLTRKLLLVVFVAPILFMTVALIVLNLKG